MKKIVLSLLLCANAVAGTECTTMDDAQSIFAKTFLQVAKMNVTSSIGSFTQLIPPAISQCVGSLDASVLIKVVMESMSEPACMKTFAWGTKIASNVTTPSNDLTKNILETMKAIDDNSIQASCAPLNDVVQCLTSTMIPKFTTILKSQPCCTQTLADAESAFGESLPNFLVHLIRYGVDIVCSVQSPGFNGAVNQTCGYSLMTSFLASANDNLMMAVLLGLKALQIPNDQGALAIAGSEFSTTLKETVNLFTAPLVPSTCGLPVENLFSWIRYFPVLSSPILGLNLSKLFDDNQCLPGGQVLSAIAHSTKDVISNETLELVQLVITDDAVCFHLANGYSYSYGTTSNPLTLFTSKLPLISSSNNGPVTTITPSIQTATPSTTQKQSSSSISTTSLYTILLLIVGLVLS